MTLDEFLKESLPLLIARFKEDYETNMASDPEWAADMEIGSGKSVS